MMKKSKKAISWYPICVFLILIPLLGTSYGDVNNVLTNPGFETGTTTGWSSHYGATISVSTSSPKTGTYCGVASGRTATYQGIQQDILSKVLDQNTYTISAYVKTNSSSKAIVKLSIQRTDNGTTTYTNVDSSSSVTTSWVKLSGTYTVPTSVSRTELYLYVEGPNSGITLYVDDANVYGQQAVADSNITGVINTTVRHQTLDGFGAAGAWYDSTLVSLGSSQSAIYDVLFGNLGLDIYRIRNAYNESGGTSYISNTATIVSKANTSLGHPIRVMISSWSPPASLKSNSDTVGGTLAKDANSNYVYADFAQWWADSLTAWSSAGVDAYYINMQNEPDYTAAWDTCYFKPTETDANAGYKQAFAALYTKLNTLSSHPKLLAPETANFADTNSYIDALDTNDKANVYGYAHHPYDDSADTPDGKVGYMAALASSYGSKPLLQTEFSGSGTFDFSDAMNLAILINNYMTIEGASAYLYWELFWNGNDSLVTITSSSYTINSVYYAMKHFSYFTDPNWVRVDANTTSSNLRISAFIDPNGKSLSAIILNTNTTTDINLTLSFTGYTVTDGNVWRSTSSSYWTSKGSYTSGSKLLLPANSITTIALSSTSVPGQATSPSPSTGATSVSITPTLSWTAGTNATSHNVYFGTSSSPSLVSSGQTTTTYSPGTLTNSTTYYWRIDEKNAGGTTTGDVWSFTTIVAAPGQATSPSPSTGATDVSISTTLSWTAGTNATSHNVYFGTSSSPSLVSSGQTTTTYSPGTLTNGTTYYWRIDEINAGGTTTGTVWSFTTIVAAPGQATSPSPSTGATDVSISTTLSWTAGTNATSHNVYFGTSNSPSLVSSGQTTTTYSPGTLTNSTTYYWRVDEINAGGTTTGTVWSFTTIVAAPGQATSPSPSTGATSISITPTLSWTAGTNATSHNVYFGTSSSPSLVSSGQTTTTYSPGTLTNSTTYYWRVDEINAGGTTTGTVWSFTTIVAAPGQATSPSPSTGATSVSITPTLSWTAGTNATSHLVYFGTTSPGTYQGEQAGTTYDTGTMASITTYYWRVDEKNAGGTTTGTVWSFTTQDIEAPTPNPIVWAIEPNAISSSSITMTATTATDISGVEYYFANITDPNHDSNWVSSPVWTDTGLVNNTTYTYQVKARDMSINLNETGWSDTVNATTFIYDCTNQITSDLDGDCEVDFFDYAQLVNAWAGNLSDIAQFAIDWLTCNRDPASECWQ